MESIEEIAQAWQEVDKEYKEDVVDFLLANFENILDIALKNERKLTEIMDFPNRLPKDYTEGEKFQEGIDQARWLFDVWYVSGEINRR